MVLVVMFYNLFFKIFSTNSQLSGKFIFQFVFQVIKNVRTQNGISKVLAHQIVFLFNT